MSVLILYLLHIVHAVKPSITYVNFQGDLISRYPATKQLSMHMKRLRHKTMVEATELGTIQGRDHCSAQAQSPKQDFLDIHAWVASLKIEFRNQDWVIAALDKLLSKESH
ncbi:hypothetical protein L1049_011414 [Liquidambar formosana]|uniref:Uncharacterized protein n=1 Tax=Liquidambar formosana TaxID=63359 RepID=A0AAP0X2U5_LIQFO